MNKQTQVHQNKQTQIKQQTAQSANSECASKAEFSQDSVSLTPQAKQLSELQKKASDAPVVDQKKVDELQKAIAAGEYKVDPQKLAVKYC